ncbi:hypothetical protein QQF64_028154 [Cirrhinus molitorella]|uniref:Uncharacterized protein n=1 Tax=Cirrhinus molitorella TaxID=172907 RepID=A0ABR3N658_9TELE
MSQRFTVTAGDIQGEVNQLFEGDEETPGASDATGAEGSGKEGVEGPSLSFPSRDIEMRTCSRLETVQPWSSPLRFKWPQRFHDNCILFVL